MSFKLTRGFKILSEISKEANSSKVLIKVKKPDSIFELDRKIDTTSQMRQYFALRPALLGNRSLNITKYLSHIIKVFEDFKLVQELREKTAKIKPYLTLCI